MGGDKIAKETEGREEYRRDRIPKEESEKLIEGNLKGMGGGRKRSRTSEMERGLVDLP